MPAKKLRKGSAVSNGGKGGRGSAKTAIHGVRVKKTRTTKEVKNNGQSSKVPARNSSAKALKEQGTATERGSEIPRAASVQEEGQVHKSSINGVERKNKEGATPDGKGSSHNDVSAAEGGDKVQEPSDCNVLVAAKEVVGRKLTIWDDTLSNWRKAEVVRFKPALGQHLLRFLERAEDTVKHEEIWFDLSKQRFQWTGPPAPDSLPNPSYRKAPKRKAAVGYKVRVFWTGMGKWYLGRILEYDVDTKKHKVKYKDGDVQELSLRHEAVIYLSDGGKGNGTPSSGNKKVTDTGEKTGKKKVRSPNNQSVEEGLEGKRNGKATKDSQTKQAKAYVKSVHLNNAIIGARIAIFSKGEEVFNRAKIEKYNEEMDKHSIFYDNGDEEWVSLNESEFRYISPKTRAGGCTSDFLKSMDVLNSEQAKSPDEIVHRSGFQGTTKPAEVISRRAPVKEACVSWRLSIRGADKKWYLGEIISYNARKDRHTVLFDDGEHEVLHLPSELIAWHCLAKDAKKPIFPGKSSTADIPHGYSAVGWRVAVFWPAENDFFLGDIASFNADSGTYDVNYDDGDHSIVDLSEEKIKWILPPGTKYDSRAFINRIETRVISEDESEEFDADPTIDYNVVSDRTTTTRKRGRPRVSGGVSYKRSHHQVGMGNRQSYSMEDDYSGFRFTVKEKQVFDVEPTFVRNISSIPAFPGLEIKRSSPIQSAIAVRIYLSNKGSSNEHPSSAGDNDLNNIENMMSRVRRAEESILKGIPTYLPQESPLPMSHVKRKGFDAPSTKPGMIVHRRLTGRDILFVDNDDSESDNLNNSRANMSPKFSRFRKKAYVSLAASMPRLPPESSSASSSDEEGGENDDDFQEPERVTSPRARPLVKGGKIKPTFIPPANVQDSESILPPSPAQVVSMEAPGPIMHSPFGQQSAQLDVLGIGPAHETDIPGMGLSESVGNLLGMSRNSSGALLLPETDMPGPLETTFTTCELK